MTCNLRPQSERNWTGDYSIRVIPLKDGMKIPEGQGKVVDAALDGKTLRCYVEESGSLNRQARKVEELRQDSLKALRNGERYEVKIEVEEKD